MQNNFLEKMKNSHPVKIVIKTLDVFSQNEMSVYSGYASLYILMAVVPLLMLVISIGVMMPGYTAEQFCEYLYEFLPDVPQVQSMVRSLVANLWEQSDGVVVSLSAVTAIWSASNGVTAIQDSLEKVRGIRRMNLKGKPKAILFTLIYTLLIPAILVLRALSGKTAELLHRVFDPLHLSMAADLFSEVVSYSGLAALIAMVAVVVLTYMWLPVGRRSLKSQMPGTVFTCVLWGAFTAGFSYFIPRFWKASSIYGSMAAIFLIAMWLKFMIMILFYGASLNRALELEKKTETAEHTA